MNRAVIHLCIEACRKLGQKHGDYCLSRMTNWVLDHLLLYEKISRFSLKLSETNFSSQKDEKVRAVEFNYIAYRNL